MSLQNYFNLIKLVNKRIEKEPKEKWITLKNNLIYKAKVCSLY